MYSIHTYSYILLAHIEGFFQIRFKKVLINNKKPFFRILKKGFFKDQISKYAGLLFYQLDFTTPGNSPL